MSEKVNEITLPALNGYVSVSTEQGSTQIIFATYGTDSRASLPNTYKTRKFLMTAYKRMEKEARKAKARVAR
jgi:hypothetical protein